MRPPLVLPSLALLTVVALSPAALADEPSAGAAVERSTGQVEAAIEPTIPSTGVALDIGADEKPVLRAGKATPSAYALFTFRPPAGRLFELRLFGPEGSVAMEVYRGDSKAPEAGTRAADRCQMWMSAASGEQTLRILVLGRRPGETPFQIGAKLYPKENE